MKKTHLMMMLMSMVLLFANTATPAMAAEESCALSITNKPGTTFVLSHDDTCEVCDLWNEVDSDGTGELKFDQSFSININDAIEVYNNYIDTTYPDGDRDHYKASEDNYNGSIFYVQARVLINDYAFDFSSRASYEYAPYGLDGEYNEGCGEWNISSYYDDLGDFLTMSKDGGVLNLSLDGTVKEIYEALKAQDEALGDVTINNLEFVLWLSCEVEYRGSWGSINYTEIGFDGLSHTLYDKHIYESTSEYDNLSVVPVTAPLTVSVGPTFEECYKPVKTEYSWYYEFIKEGEEEAEDGEYKWYGYFERDEAKESDVLTETAPSGTVYGIAYGKVDSDDNCITMNDILNEDNKDFINSFIGEKPRELGGKGQMFIGCTVTLTFEDGKQWEVYITKADYMSKLIIPCMHACTVCGLCTVTDEMLPCNFDQMSYDITNICFCEEPSVPEYEITVESEKQMTIESTERIVKVVVEQVEVEETPPNSFIINATEAVGADNVMAFYNIDVFDEEGYPYNLNQWGDMGEELTVSVPVSMEEALALQSGEAALYHILADGTAEEVEGVTVVIDGESATMTFTSSSFSPYIVARTAATYTVTFDASGGSGTMADVTGISGEYTLPDCSFTAPDGYKFKAWSVDGVEKAVGDKITVTADTTVAAVWKSEYTKLGDISAVAATASIDPVLGEKIRAGNFAITDPTDAAAKGVRIVNTFWYKKDASAYNGWKQCFSSETFEEGTYRLQVQLRTDKNADKEYYAISADTIFTVNGVMWNSNSEFYDLYATSGYGYRLFVSPEFTLCRKTLDSIAVTTPPTKTVYREGEDFDPAGMVVTATYTDSTTAPVVLYTVTDGIAMAAGKTSVTISYTEDGVNKTTMQAITVVKEHTVTFDASGGSGTMADVTAISGEYTLPGCNFTAPDGYKFKAWSVEGIEKAVGDKITVTADTTVTAVWEHIELKLSFVWNGDNCTIKLESLEGNAVIRAASYSKKRMEGLIRFDADTMSATLTGDTVKVFCWKENLSPLHQIVVSAKP